MFDRILRILKLRPREDRAPSSDESYRIFSTEYDEEISADQLLKLDEENDDGTAHLPPEHDRIDMHLLQAERKVVLARAAAEAERAKSALAGCRERPSLTVLVDHSGSMRGAQMQKAMLASEAASIIALKIGLPFEILGFTTVEWRGTPVRQLWQASGSARAPGRLCALRHIVYSAFEDQHPPDLSAMLLPTVLKENVDGEAILWAAERARRSQAQRHMLVVLSDGAPVDDSTLAENDHGILWNHLKTVIREIEGDQKFLLMCVSLHYEACDLYATEIEINRLNEIHSYYVPFLTNEIISFLLQAD